LLDRGYRDAVLFLENLGMNTKMPPFVVGNRRLTTEEANSARIATKGRWRVESRNGHFKTIFKFLGNTVSNTHAVSLGDFNRIGGAINNKYRLAIVVPEETEDLAREILLRAQTVNVVQARVEQDQLHWRHGQWMRLPADGNALPDFPLITEE